MAGELSQQNKAKLKKVADDLIAAVHGVESLRDSLDESDSDAEAEYPWVEDISLALELHFTRDNFALTHTAQIFFYAATCVTVGYVPPRINHSSQGCGCPTGSKE